MEEKQACVQDCFVIWATFGSGGFGFRLLSLGRHAENLQHRREDERMHILCTNHSSSDSAENADQASVLAKSHAIVAKS